MPRQEGIILLTGPVGNLSFYKSKGVYFVRRKSGVSAERINSEPAYARTRENIAEFRRATLATKVFRSAFRPLFESAADNRVSSRLTGLMVKVIQGDAKNLRGQRNVMHGNVSLLERFEINRKSNLSSIFRAPFTTAIDRAAGTMVIDVPSFIPASMISFPKGATHYRLKAGGAAINFEKNNSSVTISETACLPIIEEMQGPLQLRLKVPPASVRLFMVLGIEFLQMVNGIQHPLANVAYNAMAIIKAGGSEWDEKRYDHDELSAPRQLWRHRALSVPRTTGSRPPLRKVPACGPGVLIEDDRVYRNWGSGLDRDLDSS